MAPAAIPDTNAGMNLRLFRPAVDSKGHFSVNGTDVLGHLDLSFGLVIDWARGILPLGTPSQEVVNNLFSGTAHFNIGLFNVAAVGFQVPVVIMDGPMRMPAANMVSGLQPGPYGYQGL